MAAVWLCHVNLALSRSTAHILSSSVKVKQSNCFPCEPLRRLWVQLCRLTLKSTFNDLMSLLTSGASCVHRGVAESRSERYDWLVWLNVFRGIQTLINPATFNILFGCGTFNILFRCGTFNTLFGCGTFNTLFGCGTFNILFRCGTFNILFRCGTLCPMLSMRTDYPCVV